MAGEEERSIAVIGGAYGFTKNLLLAMMNDLIRQGADDARLLEVLKDVGDANQNIPEGLGRDLADAMTTHSYALILKFQAEREQRGRTSPPR